jgi:chromosome segregation ATPase
MEIDSLNNEFRRFNAKLIDNNLNVTNLRESIKEKKVDLQSLKSKYKSLTKDTEELGVEMNQQRILINELERTKSQYLNMIEDITNKKDNEHRNIADGEQYIDRLQKDIVALKDNVYNLKSTKKKAA